MIARTLVLKPNMRRLLISLDSDTTVPLRLYQSPGGEASHPYLGYHAVNKVVIKLLRKISNIYDILAIVGPLFSTLTLILSLKGEDFIRNCGYHKLVE